MRINLALKLSVLFLCMTLVACSAGTRTRIVEEKKDIVVGFSMEDIKNERWQKDRDLFEARVKELGGYALILSSDRDAAKQAAQIESLIQQKVNVIVIKASSSKEVNAGSEKAHQTGIKILAYDSLIKNVDIDFYVTFDNEKVGEIQATEVVKQAPAGNYVYIGGSETDNNALLVRKGSMKVLEQHADKIKVVYDQYSKDWAAAEAKKNMEAALAKFGKNIQGVVTGYDGLVDGAIVALSLYGLAGKVPITGQDAELAALQRIVEGKQTATVYKPIKKLAEASADIAVALAKNQELKKDNKINNGKIDVPYLYLEPFAITKDNMISTVIKDGFQTMEDVYKHIPKDQWPKN